MLSDIPIREQDLDVRQLALVNKYIVTYTILRLEHLKKIIRNRHFGRCVFVRPVATFVCQY